jgi:hypothetical protein
MPVSMSAATPVLVVVAVSAGMIGWTVTTRADRDLV